MLEVACGKCGHLFMRWTADLDKPFDERRWGPTPGIRIENLGAVSRSAHIGPDEDGAEWGRWWFTCPNGCRTGPQARVEKLHAAATIVLREMHDTHMPPLTMTVDKLLTFAP